MEANAFLPIFAVRLKKRGVVLQQEIDFQNLVFENVDNSTSKILVRNKSRLLLHSCSKNGCAKKRKRSLKVRETIALCSDENRNGTKGKSSEYNFDLTR